MDISLRLFIDSKEKKAETEEFNEEDIVGPRMYIEEEEDQSKQLPTETVINVEAPRINADLGNQIHFVKFPNFLSVEPRVFDAETYEDEIDEDEVLDEEGRSRLKLKVENTIRWRNSVDEEGNPNKESNAKIVRWSDGTMSLYLGSEIFDVHLQPTVGDHNHLFVRQGQGLQGQAVFRTKLTFRPHSTDTLTHRKMTLSMADRSSKAQKVKVLAEVGTDPETQKQALVKQEEERLRASARRESQQRRIREKNLHRGLSHGFLEPDRDLDDSDEGESLGTISLKKRHIYKPGGKDFDKAMRGLSDTDESDDSTEGRNKLKGAKKMESDEEEEEEEEEEVEKEDSPAEERTAKKRKVIEDSDED